MSGCCSDPVCSSGPREPGDGYGKVLVWALVLNLVLFFIEIGGAYSSGSVSLLADAIDFLGDSINFGASLLVLGMAPMWSSRLALGKGLVMTSWGVLVFARALWAWSDGVVPVHETMTWISFLALATNGLVAFLLYRHRKGDANRSSVWLCARNDAFANVAVLVAAQSVAFTGKGWPDLVAACGLAALGLSSGLSVVRRAWNEMSVRSAA
jgi:Co/Zn/Cd efflux system component